MKSRLLRPKLFFTCALLFLLSFSTVTEFDGFIVPVSAEITPQNITIQNFLAQEYGKRDVIKQQSYPVVGGYWTTEFVTFGTHDLVITAIDGTTFWGLNSDVSFVELYDGMTKLVPVIKNNKIIFPNYSSDDASHLKVKVNAPGVHNIKLEFGSDVAYANNNASPSSTVEINDGTANGPVLTDNDRFGTSIVNIEYLE